MKRLAGLLGLLLVWGCHRAPSSSARPQELRIAQLTSAITLDPHRHDSYYATVTLGHFYGRLVNFGPNLELMPELAVRWESPSDTTWRFHLRDRVLFHDGRRFGAADVVASIQRARGPSSHVRPYVQRIRDVKALDRLTVEIETDGPAPVLLNALPFVMIVPRDTGPEEITRPIGTGPYRFVSGAPGAAIVGERFDGYWGPAPAFARLEILPMPSDEERERAIPAGKADVVAQFPPEAWDRAKEERSQTLVSRQGLGVDFVTFSFTPGNPFADRRVRQAVALAVDRQAIVRDALHGLATPAWQLVPPMVFGFVQGLPQPPRDPARARALLAEAGFRDGIRTKLVVSNRVEAMGRELARQLAEIGITLELQVLSQDEFYASTLRRDMPMTIDSYVAATGDAANVLEAELHSRRSGLGTFTVAAYANPKLDELIERSGAILDPKPRNDVLQEALRVAADDIPVVPLAVRPDLYALRRGLRWDPRHPRINAEDVAPAPAP